MKQREGKENVGKGRTPPDAPGCVDEDGSQAGKQQNSDYSHSPLL
jgi:hypothetical protein